MISCINAIYYKKYNLLKIIWYKLMKKCLSNISKKINIKRKCKCKSNIIKKDYKNKIKKITAQKSKILFNLFLIIIYLLTYNDYNIKNGFNDILPRLSLNETIPSPLSQIFNSTILYIPEADITKEYIRYIRPINEIEEKNNIAESEVIIDPKYYQKRKNQFNYKVFSKLCLEEELIYPEKIEYNENPIISIILPHYNRAKMLLSSIRSIQNQSFKNIEIIIVNDCSTDNSYEVFDYLLKTDPRIRIFHHKKNMGLFRSRVDGFLYARGKYLISLEPDDLYEDNYVLEDAYNIFENYNVDSVAFLWRHITDYNLIERGKIFFHPQISKAFYGRENVEKNHNTIFHGIKTIWNRPVKSNIYFKALYLLENYVLNIFKNACDDIWQNIIINRVSNSIHIMEKSIYIYFVDGNGYGTSKFNTIENRDKVIKEYLGFLYFDYNMAAKTDNKHEIVEKIIDYNGTNPVFKLEFLRTKFYVLYDLIHILLKDRYVSKKDKIKLKKILEETKKKEKNMK